MSRSLRSAKNSQPQVDPPGLKLESEESEPLSLATPSFRGRLNISNFAYKSQRLGLTNTIANAEQASEETKLVPQKNPQISPDSKRKLDALDLNNSPPMKRIRPPSGYAPPSTYAHLPGLPDAIESNLICLFVGLNPGIRTAIDGHAYAHPSNLFWKLLHSSGCTTRRCKPEEDQDLPRLFSLGSTNIVARPTRNGSQLSKAEMDASVHILEQKIRRYKPEAVCSVGKSIWESIWRVKYGRPIKKEEFKYGWQDEAENMGRITPAEAEEGEGSWEGAKVFVASSTSGLAASLLPAEKERIWRELGVWVEARRKERNLSEKVT